MTAVKVELPPKLIPLFAPPRGALRYRGAYGGRGSGKSFNFAKMAAIWGYAEPLRILCTREIQASIKESFHAELKNAIASEPWLSEHYDVGVDYLRGKNGTEFLFRGLRHGMGSIKSMAQIDLCIIEEAEDVPERSYVDLLPTIRAPLSEIWVIWNPRDRESPTDTRFRQSQQPRSMFVGMNYSDNPWFPPVLDEQRIADQRNMDTALYAHIWDGEYYEASDRQIFNGKWGVDDFKPAQGWDGPYYGMDFGFAQDPTAAVECWIHQNRLYIYREAGKVSLELDHTADYFTKRIDGIQSHIIRADSARPESISYLSRHGLPRIDGVKKWQGSVEDGIQFLRSFEKIVIHPECREMQKEARLYSYKTNSAGDILPVPEDANNHYWDAVRYAMAPHIKQRGAKAVRMRF